MTAASSLLAVVLAVFFAGLGMAKLLALPAMRHRAAEAGFGVDAYRRIGGLELAGAIGLLAGIVLSPVGAAAGAGLLVLLAGAVATHLRNGDEPTTLAPAAIAGTLVIGYLALQAVAA